VGLIPITEAHAVGVRFSLDARKGPLGIIFPGNYGVQLLGLRAERNFGRISVERVSEDRRVYRFHLGIHGKARSLLHDMELDLDNILVTPEGVPPNPTVASLPSSLTPGGLVIDPAFSS